MPRLDEFIQMKHRKRSYSWCIQLQLVITAFSDAYGEALESNERERERESFYFAAH